MRGRGPNFNLERVSLSSVRGLFERFHGYGSAGSGGYTYCWSVIEGGRPVAAYVWQPPPLGSARAVAPEAPQGVLSLSRMVAVPRAERRLNHVSKPLRRQMRHLIDRGRWPSLVTYSDQGQGHTGHVYKCSGWHASGSRRVSFYTCPKTGDRVSRRLHAKRTKELSPDAVATKTGTTVLTRWEHHIEKGHSAEIMRQAGWVREPVPGRVWRSGNQAYRWVQITQEKNTQTRRTK